MKKSELWAIIKRNNLSITGVSEAELNKKGAGRLKK